MAIQDDIGKRLDQMLPTPLGNQDEPIPLTDESLKTINLLPDVPEPQVGEGEQVAGGVGLMKSWAAARKIKKEAPVASVLYERRVEGETIIPDASKKVNEDGKTNLEVAEQAEQTTIIDPAKADIKPGRVPPIRVEGDLIIVEPASVGVLEKMKAGFGGRLPKGKPPRIRPNLSAINAETDVKQLAYMSTKPYQIYIDEQRRAGRTLEDIVQDALKMGDDAALKALINRNPGDRPMLDSETLAARMAVLNLQQATKDTIQEALTSGNPQTMLNALKAITFEGYVQASLLGNAAEAGRTLAIHRLVASVDKERAAQLQLQIEKLGLQEPGVFENAANPAAVIRELGGMQGIRDALVAYMKLPDDARRMLYAKRLGGAPLEAVAEIYQSALLSNPVTHGFNFLGTPAHTLSMLAERTVASMITLDKHRFIGTMAGMRAIPRYFRQSMAAAWKAFKTEEASDAASKFDAGNRLAITPQNFGVAADTVLGQGIKYFGISTRLLGFRVLTTVDEGWKAMLRGMELEMMASESASRAFSNALKDGFSEADALKQSGIMYRQTLESPQAFEQAAEFARVATFQNEVPGKFLKSIEPVMAHPLQKILGPLQFFKTPVQVALAIQERTPLAIAMPRFWKAMTNPAKPGDRSLAIAKLMTGAGMASAFMTIGYDDDGTMITGYGPTNPNERRAWLKKHQPYSFGFKQEDGSYEWVSYERYDPISGVLAMWMDVRDTWLKMEPGGDPEAAEDIGWEVLISTMRYMGEAQPMVQTLNEIASVIGPNYEGETPKLQRMGELLQKQMTDVGLTVGQHSLTLGMAPQSLTASVERYLTPWKKSTLPTDQYAYTGADIGFRTSLRGVYEAIAKARSRVPYFDQELWKGAGTIHYDTNDWGEPINIGTGDFRAWLPTKIINKKYNALDQEFINLGSFLPRLERSMGEGMIKLNNAQWVRYKELVNYPGRSDKLPMLLFPMNYDQEGKLVRPLTDQQKKIIKSQDNRLDALMAAINSNEYMAAAKPAEKMEILKTDSSEFLSLAKDLMLLEFPELAELMNQRDKFKEEYIRPPTALPLSPSTQQSMGYQPLVAP